MKSETAIDYTFLALINVLLALCLFAPYADAQKLQVIPLRLIVIERADTSTQDQIDLFLEGASRFAEVGAYIDIKDIKVYPDHLQLNQFEDYIGRIFDWHKWAIKNKVTTNKMLTHFLLPPIIFNGVTYQGGVAGATCTTKYRNSKRLFSYSIVRNKNDKGEDRREHSRVVAMHELLHNLGAQHVESLPNIMHSAAMSFNPVFKTFLIHRLTKKDVKRCRDNKGLQYRENAIERLF